MMWRQMAWQRGSLPLLALLLVPALLQPHCEARGHAEPRKPHAQPPGLRPCWENRSLASMPYCDPSIDVVTRAKDLVGRLTRAEKIGQFLHSQGAAVSRLGVAFYQYHSEGLHGIRTACVDVPGIHSTLFPQVTGLAATGNLSLIRAMASAMGDEARALNNIANGTTFDKGTGLDYWGPTMNIGRDPRWGRFQESVSECPWLNGAYAYNFVRGMQGDDPRHVKIAATCKHWYAYSLEDSDGKTRHDFDANVSARDLAETYLVPFQPCVAASVEQIMCSYNAVNQVPTCLDGQALNGVLRGEFEFKGLVSDCDSIQDAWSPDKPNGGSKAVGFGGHGYARNESDATALALRNGCDMDCGDTFMHGIEAALATGRLQESDLDRAIQRAFSMRMRLGMFDEHVPYRDTNTYGRATLDSVATRDLALQAAEESIVLLSNDATPPLLPLRKPAKASAASSSGATITVGLIGPTVNDSYTLMGSKEDYCPSSIVTVQAGLEEASERPGSFFRIVLGPGGLGPIPGCHSCPIPPPAPPTDVAAFARSVDVVVLCLGGKSPLLGGEGMDWNATLPATQLELARAVVSANPKTIVVIITGNPMAIDWLAEHATTIVHAFEGGQAAGTALSNMLLGETDRAPGGVMPWTTYPEAYTAQVQMSDMSMRAGPGRTYRFFSGVPTYPFGFGKTYSSFAMEWIITPQQSQSVATLRAGLQYELNVTNTGSMAGSKVIGAYSSYANMHGGPLKELFAMEKVRIAPGASQRVVVRTDSLPGTCTFCSINEDGVAAVRPGLFTVTIGDGGRGSGSTILSHTLSAA